MVFGAREQANMLKFVDQSPNGKSNFQILILKLWNTRPDRGDCGSLVYSIDDATGDAVLHGIAVTLTNHEHYSDLFILTFQKQSVNDLRKSLQFVDDSYYPAEVLKSQTRISFVAIRRKGSKSRGCLATVINVSEGYDLRSILVLTSSSCVSPSSDDQTGYEALSSYNQPSNKCIPGEIPKKQFHTCAMDTISLVFNAQVIHFDNAANVVILNLQIPDVLDLQLFETVGFGSKMAAHQHTNEQLHLEVGHNITFEEDNFFFQLVTSSINEDYDIVKDKQGRSIFEYHGSHHITGNGIGSMLFAHEKDRNPLKLVGISTGDNTSFMLRNESQISEFITAARAKDQNDTQITQ